MIKIVMSPQGIEPWYSPRQRDVVPLDHELLVF